MIGPNGIGKSTLLKIIMGRLDAGAGTVEWGHQVFPGYFAQDHRELLADSQGTVESWLSAACPGQSVGWVRAQLAKVLFSGDEVEKKVASLSGGEAARLIFARLTVDHPNVLVLDEPTVGLDQVLRNELWAQFARLAATGRALLVSSHVMDEANRCDRLVLLRGGTVLAQGSPAELLERTRTDDVEAAFLTLVAGGEPS